MTPAPQEPTPKLNKTKLDLIQLIADVYGIEVTDISPDSDLTEDIGWSMNPEELAFFLKRLNTQFDVHLSKDVILSEECETVGDLADLIESEQLG